MPARTKVRAEPKPQNDESTPKESTLQLMCQFVDETGEKFGAQLVLPASATTEQLDQLLCLSMSDENKTIPYAFFINSEQVTSSVADLLLKKQREAFVEKQLKEGRRVRPQDAEALEFSPPLETTITILFKPQAVFRVRPVTRCSATLDGHSEAVLVVCFSPDSLVLATGGGDNEIRIWDIYTNTPTCVLQEHKHWVQVLSWSPNSQYLVSGSREGSLLVWRHGEHYADFKSKAMKSQHKNYVSHVSWEPLHVNPKCHRFASASKDSGIKIWHVELGLQLSLSGHQDGVTCVKWGGENMIFSSSQDKTIIVWDANTGSPLSQLKSHAHWVNFIALNTDLVIRTGSFDHEDKKFQTEEESQQHAKKRYDAVVSRSGGQRLISCSDDNTLYLWTPSKSTVPSSRMVGHQAAIFHACFSPDGSLVASCSADKSVRLWNALTGAFITTFRGHVAPVYHVSWSLDSRMIASGSRDSTLKVWSVETKSLVEDLTGHLDEIFSTDWSPDGTRIATGSKDKKVRIWVH